MARDRRTSATWIIVLAAIVLTPATMRAQSNIPLSGVTPPTPIADPNVGPLPADFQSYVSFLDSALPRSHVRLRFDVDQFNYRPTRAEYLFPGDAFRVPETRVHVQEFNTYVEYGLNEWFSTFMETPYKWVNPDQNRNVSGIGDFHFGAKFAGWNSEALLTAFQLRFGAHSAQHPLTGTGHWSIEPSLLMAWRIKENLTLEGQVGYYVPLGGTDYAGDVLKYGIGLSYGQRTGDTIQLIPVAEVIGWTVTGGKELVSTGPGTFAIDPAAGNTILNGCLGLRFSLGHNADVYTGYSRGILGDAWYRDMFRLELRIFY